MKNKILVMYFLIGILIIVVLFLVGGRRQLTRLLMSEFACELIPTVFSCDENFIIEEFIPVLYLDNDSENMNDTSIFSYDDMSILQDYTEGVYSATPIDALYADEPLTNQSEDLMTDSGQTAETHENPITETVSSVISNVSVISPTPITYSMEQLTDFQFLVDNCYTVDSTTNVNTDELNAANLLSMDMSIDLSTEDIKVLIYHTHGSEAFSNSQEGVTEDTIIGVGDELARILEENYGIRVYHDRNIYDMVDGVLDRDNAYELSSAGVDAVLAMYPSIEVVLDVHRDGVREGVRLVRTVNGKETAQIMFLNGMSRLNVEGDLEFMPNPYKIENMAFSLQMHLAGKAMYGDLMRHIYIRGYRYNLEKRPRAALIEVGAQTNTVEEAKNAMEPLANIIYNVLSGE